VTHYALAHPEKHFELHSATNAMLLAAPVESHADRIYQVFGRETLDQLVPVTAGMKLERVVFLNLRRGVAMKIISRLSPATFACTALSPSRSCRS